MLYLNKILCKIKENPTIFKDSRIISILGMPSGQIKDLKKYALENQLITQSKQEYFLTSEGEKYLEQNPIQSWATKKYNIRPNINIELLKEEKNNSVFTRAIRLVARHLILNEPLKEGSFEEALFEEVKNNEKLILKIENDILNGKRISLENIFEKYLTKGLTKPLISAVLLFILSRNTERIAIYEKSQFQLNFDALMFDRMVVCPQNFEIQKTEMTDAYILKDVSKIILNKKSDNILEITKGLYKTIKNLDKYVMQTENLSSKTLRLRNIIVNAKDPISLFERDIPKVLSGKTFQDCDRDFLNNLKISLDELKNCTNNLVKDLKKFILNSFNAKSKEELVQRFLEIKEYIGEKELKILLNNVIEINVQDELWVNRIATFINKSRVPKDWNDEDYCDFKVKTKELALSFFVLESTIGTNETLVGKNYHKMLGDFLNLTKQERMIFLRKAINC